MTDKQIKAAKDRLPRLRDMNEEQEREYAELSCREMINSILCYHGERGLFTENGDLNRYLYRKGSDHEYYGIINSPYNEKEDKLDRYLEERWQKRSSMFYVPRKRIIELVKEQQSDFAKAVVKSGVYTDYEGCTYNSCVWADEM